MKCNLQLEFCRFATCALMLRNSCTHHSIFLVMMSAGWSTTLAICVKVLTFGMIPASWRTGVCANQHPAVDCHPCHTPRTSTADGADSEGTTSEPCPSMAAAGAASTSYVTGAARGCCERWRASAACARLLCSGFLGLLAKDLCCRPGSFSSAAAAGDQVSHGCALDNCALALADDAKRLSNRSTRPLSPGSVANVCWHVLRGSER
jgi:hypothetical protein